MNNPQGGIKTKMEQGFLTAHICYHGLVINNGLHPGTEEFPTKLLHSR